MEADPRRAEIHGQQLAARQGGSTALGGRETRRRRCTGRLLEIRERRVAAGEKKFHRRKLGLVELLERLEVLQAGACHLPKALAQAVLLRCELCCELVELSGQLAC